jgi:glycosyltransferase involved in cell wall biosynthesis
LHNRLRAATLEKWQERWVVQNADRIITASEPIREDFLVRYPRLSRNRTVVITNGYDADDFARIDPQPQAKFTFTFTGSLSKANRSPEPLLKGAQVLLAQHPTLAERFQILLVGGHTPEQATLPARYNLGSVVRMLGPVPYRDALIHQVSANVNVFIYDGPSDGRSTQMMSGKIFEYAGAGRPILAIAPQDSSAAQLVEQLQIGRVVRPEAPRDIAEAMYTFLTEPRLINVPAERLTPFHRRHLTGHLANILDQIVMDFPR